jgi:hypothetical protein
MVLVGAQTLNRRGAGHWRLQNWYSQTVLPTKNRRSSCRALLVRRFLFVHVLAIHPAFFGMKELRSCSLQDELFDRFGKPFFVHSSSDVSG